MANDKCILLDDWLSGNAWDCILVSDDKTEEAIGNLSRLFLSAEEAKLISISQLIGAIKFYIHIKQSQVICDKLDPMLLYVWHDEMSGSLCISCISRSHLPGLPFGCAIDECAEVSDIASAFLNSSYLDGIPTSELMDVDCSQASDQGLAHAEFILPVYSIALEGGNGDGGNIGSN